MFIKDGELAAAGLRCVRYRLQNGLSFSHSPSDCPLTPIHFHFVRMVTVWVFNTCSLLTLIIEFSSQVSSFLPEITFNQSWYDDLISIICIANSGLLSMCVVESSLSGKTHPSTPAMYKFRPSFGTMPKVHYHAAGEKVRQY